MSYDTNRRNGAGALAVLRLEQDAEEVRNVSPDNGACTFFKPEYEGVIFPLVI